MPADRYTTEEIPKSRITLTYRTKVNGLPEDLTLPFRVLVLGDLSLGTSKDRQRTLEDRAIRTLDGKNLNHVMADMNMTLRLEVPNKINPDVGGDMLKVELPIRSIKSFSPAEIANNVPKIKSLLLLKKLLLESQSNYDNRKGYREMIRALAKNKDAIASLQKQLPGFDNFRLPPRSSGNGQGAAES